MKVSCLWVLAALPLAVPGSLGAQSSSGADDSIPALIDQLVMVDSMPTFYAGTFRFKEFPPVDQAPLPPFPPTGEISSRDAAFRAMIRLVEIGPGAIPYLLEHLDDQRETATVVQDDYAETMGPSSFLDYRRGSPREESVIRDAGLPQDNPGPDFDSMLEDYTLTVGDMCFALLGMITNRSYYILIDEFGAQLNSPMHSERIVAGAREIWGPLPDPIDLYESLKLDLESGDLLFANSAATRLLYYFPSISDNLIITRLARLMRAHQPGDDTLADFLEAISWTRDARITSTLRRFLHHASDASQVAAAAKVYGFTRDPRGWEQLVHLADRLKPRRDPSYLEASRSILKLNLLTYPARREATLRCFLEGAGSYAQISACVVSEEVEGTPVAPLVPLLTESSTKTGARYLIKGEGAEQWPEADDYLPYRVCDRAYETISRLLGDHEATALGTAEDMDRQIADLRRHLAGKSAPRPFTSSELEARKKMRENR